uniref:Sushi domain-containing protein n=1 Tax=Sinocyclocheilus grahami TaxID=75366 RepID=A0A672N103_SINGR
KFEFSKVTCLSFTSLCNIYLCFSECLREDIKYENTEPVAKASYADGETVKVNCMVGYTGFYRLKCEKGEWTKSTERPYKKCSHPGDTPHGDFKFMEGTEFVFGATVVYTCKKGYEMASRTNQRTCRAQGWDNAVPVCEVVKCPAIRTDGDVTASGNTEEGSYGDVIHFECVSSDKIIDRSSDIYCEETGKWSDIVPKCKGAIFIVFSPQPKYQKDAILKYKCNQGFKEREEIPRCDKSGWTLNPGCHGNPPLLYNKQFIWEICESGYRERANVATCTRDGWIPKPLCTGMISCGVFTFFATHIIYDYADVCFLEIMCDPPKIPNAEIFLFFF